MTGQAAGFRDTNLREMMDQAVAQCPIGVALLDTQMRHLRLNDMMCRILGLRGEAEGLNVRLTDLISTPETEACVACARSVARTGKPDVWRGTFQLPGQRRDHAVDVYLSPVADPGGRVRGVLAVGVDVSEQRLARQRLALVNEASTRIGSTLDITRTAEELVEVAVPRFADLAMIDLLDAVVRGDEPTADPIEGSIPLHRLAVGSVVQGIPEVVARPGQVDTYPEYSPVAECLATGRPVSFSGAGRHVAQWARVDAARADSIVRHGVRSMMLVPVRARGATLGVAVFVRHKRLEPFADDDILLAEEIVGRAAVCIDNARRYTREHMTALALQRSLLQQRQPVQSAVEVATRYLPAHSGVAVGGDWFDVIRLSGSRVGLVVGDVAGHGIHAAATMGRLRTAVQTLADVDLEPEELLTRLDDVVARLASEQEPSADAAEVSATCLYAVYDPVSRCCTLARAGHPVPAVVTPGGSVEFLDLPAGPPLGVGGLPFEEAEVELPEGSLLVLYTDGLVESRQRDIDAGLSAMRKVLSDVRPRPDGPALPSLDTICDSLVDALLPEQAGDDAALLIARTRALAADRIASWDLPADPAVVADARARAARQLAAWGLEEITFTTELLVSELVTNAIRHAHEPIQLRMILNGVLSCEVFDGSSSAPQLRRADRYDEDGRGLMLVAQLAERWGTRHNEAGKIIWAQQPLPRRLGLPADARVARNGVGGVGRGTPLRHGHEAWFDEVQPGEVAADLLPGAQVQPGPAHLRIELRGGAGHALGVDVTGGVGDGQVAAGRHGAHDPGHDLVRTVRIRDVLQGHQEHDGDRLAEVELLGGLSQDPAGIAGVGLDVGGGALGGAGQQRPGVREDDRVVVHVDDPGFRRDLLGDLVRVIGGGQAGPDIQELPDPGLTGQVLHGPAQEGPVGPDTGQDIRVSRDGLLCDVPVGLVVVLPAEPVIVDPGGVRDAGVER
jgi:PAS domain S-box-containing protein